MDKYTIHCTPEQTKKALELGAPIEELEYNCQQGWVYEKVTSEQMIGWLRSKGIQFHFDDETGYWNVGNAKTPFRWQGYSDKKELVAIDAALDFLENNR